MNKLYRETRARILHLLCEGQSIRAVTRLTGASKNTITKLVVDAGHACTEYQDRVLRNLPSKRVQVDEIWNFIYAKADHVKDAKAAPKDAGDVWTWTAIDADSKLLVSWLVADRTTDSAVMFMDDLKERLTNRNSDPNHISTSYAERQNLTMRMHMRRFTRLTNAFSKKIENHACAVALHSMYYNFVRLHQTLKISPAMAAGVTDRLWEMVDVVDVLDAFGAKRMRARKPVFEVEKWAIGGGYYVRATLPDGTVERIEGFATEGEAARWIRNDSTAWLHTKLRA
jgi:IS1 family transposase